MVDQSRKHGASGEGPGADRKVSGVYYYKASNIYGVKVNGREVIQVGREVWAMVSSPFFLSHVLLSSFLVTGGWQILRLSEMQRNCSPCLRWFATH